MTDHLAPLSSFFSRYLSSPLPWLWLWRVSLSLYSFPFRRLLPLVLPAAPLLLSIYILTFLQSGIGSSVIGHFINGAGETRLNLKAKIVNVVVFVPLVLALANMFGTLGIVVSLLASNLVSLIYQLIEVKRRFDIGLFPKDAPGRIGFDQVKVKLVRIIREGVTRQHEAAVVGLI